MKTFSKFLVLKIFLSLATLALGNGDFKVQRSIASTRFRDKSPVCSSYADGVAIPHQRDCEQFYVCLNQTLILLNCENNYHFNAASMSCVPGSCQKDDLNMLKTCPTNTNALRRINDNCHAFAWCYSGVEEQFQCPAGYYFDATNAKCQTIQNTASFKCSCLYDEFTVLPNDDDCQTFYTCISGKAFLQRCGYGYYFNNQVQACLPDVEKVCRNAKMLRTSKRTTSNICQRSSARKNIFQANSRSCKQFFVCLNEEAFEESCPKGFYFDSSSGYCRRDVFGKCTTSFLKPLTDFHPNEILKNEQKASAEEEYESVHSVLQANDLENIFKLPSSTSQQKPASHVYEKLLSKFMYS